MLPVRRERRTLGGYLFMPVFLALSCVALFVYVKAQDLDSIDDAAWARYVFIRPNPKGPMAERWVHTAGCRRWFNVVRDTVTHEITRDGGDAR